MQTRYSKPPASFKPRAAHATPRGALVSSKHVIVTSAGRVEVEDDGTRWIAGAPLPKDREPNSPLALCRHAEAAAERGTRAGEKERRAA